MAKQLPPMPSIDPEFLRVLRQVLSSNDQAGTAKTNGAGDEYSSLPPASSSHTNHHSPVDGGPRGTPYGDAFRNPPNDPPPIHQPDLATAILNRGARPSPPAGNDMLVNALLQRGRSKPKTGGSFA